MELLVTSANGRSANCFQSSIGRNDCSIQLELQFCHYWLCSDGAAASHAAPGQTGGSVSHVVFPSDAGHKRKPSFCGYVPVI